MSDERFKHRVWMVVGGILRNYSDLIVTNRNFPPRVTKWRSLIFLINKLNFNFILQSSRAEENFRSFEGENFRFIFSSVPFCNTTFQWWFLVVFIVTRRGREQLHSFHFAFTRKIFHSSTAKKNSSLFNLCFMFCTIKFLWLCLDVYTFIMFRCFSTVRRCCCCWLTSSHFASSFTFIQKEAPVTTPRRSSSISHFSFYLIVLRQRSKVNKYSA